MKISQRQIFFPGMFWIIIIIVVCQLNEISDWETTEVASSTSGVPSSVLSWV